MHQAKGLRRGSGFTLIELLVVVAIIALLISILMPSLNGARKSAKATKCAANLRSVGQAFAMYLGENNGTYPPAYVYPTDDNGSWSTTAVGQDVSRGHGYMHWSYFLFNRGTVKADAFTCPDFTKGGAPRTNPGPRPEDWEGHAQQDDTGSGPPGAREDKQAPRLAYTANAVIIPRNKFFVSGALGNPGPRYNVLVREQTVRESRGVILATEFLNDWKALSEDKGGGVYLSKSHRPIQPFYSQSSGAEEYSVGEPPDFSYGEPTAAKDYGLRSVAELDGVPNVIGGSRGPEINAVGRHHPGGDRLGGTANFLYIDGSVARKTVFDTLKRREWGTAYYSLFGTPRVLMNE